MTAGNTWPKLHNAMWPGLVGKGGDAEPPIDLETMLDLTAAAEVDGARFDGVDNFSLEFNRPSFVKQLPQTPLGDPEFSGNLGGKLAPPRFLE